MSILAIVLGCGMYTAFNSTQAIFLTKAGPRAYPVFFIVLALSVWPMITLQSFVTRRLGVARSLRYNLLVNAVIPLPIYVAYRVAETPAVSFVAYVIYSLAFELVMLVFWSFVAQYFNLLEGKRIYPVVAAASGLGYIFAGAITTAVAGGPLGTEGLMFVWAVGAGLAGLLAYRSQRRLFRPALEDDADEVMAEAVGRPGHLLSNALAALRYLAVSRLVLALVVLGTVLLVAMRVSDYLVAVVFVSQTHGDLQDLTILIGNSWMLSYVVQLFLGLWVTPWILAKAGVKNAILALPVATLLGFTLVALSPGLGTALFLFVVRNGLQTGVDDPAENVLSGALPEQVAPRLKTLLENLVLPGSAVIAGVGLVVTSSLFPGTSLQVLAVIGILVSAAFLGAALVVRSLYVNAVYQRLRSHTLSLSDLQLALGRPSAIEIEELKGFIEADDPNVREFAAAALGRMAPDVLAKMAPQLVASEDPRVRRLAIQQSPPGALPNSLLDTVAQDPDAWVRAAAAVAGSATKPPWPPAAAILEALGSEADEDAKCASVWAAAFTRDQPLVVAALNDPSWRVRLEGIRSFAKLKANVAGAADPLIACLRDDNTEVRREAMRQAIRWAPPAGNVEEFESSLLAGLTSNDPITRKLAGEATSIQCPGALDHAMTLLEGDTAVGVATIEALTRSGRSDLVARAQSHLEEILEMGLDAASAAARLRAFARLAGSTGEDFRFAALRIALEDFQNHVIEMSLGGLRALHEKRGFARVERGLRSSGPGARAEATETLLNFGPSRIVDPLVRLLDPDGFEGSPAKPLTETELDLLQRHPNTWVKRSADAILDGSGDTMKDLIALKKVPLFAALSLEQLASIDRLMVTRRYEKGEQIFKWGDFSSELYVVLEGEVRIHRDHGSDQLTLAKVGPSGFMGEMAPFTEQPRTASAQALVATTVRVLRKDRLNAILQEHPEVLLEVIKNLSQRLVVANEQLETAAQALKEPDMTPANRGQASKD